MTNSLVIANTIELLGGGVVSNIPQCAGARFGILTTGDFDLSAPQPTADFVANLILDGERPYGRRASNRTIKLPVRITTPGITGTASLLLLAAAREVLEQAVDQDRWTLTWTRDGGLPLLIDCFRAQPSKPLYDPRAEGQGVMRLTLTIPALPYGRSDTETQVAFTSPVPASPRRRRPRWCWTSSPRSAAPSTTRARGAWSARSACAGTPTTCSGSATRAGRPPSSSTTGRSATPRT